MSDYKYGDKVRVTSGVFEGMEGTVKNASGNRYLVTLEGKKARDWTVEWLPGKQLELIQREGCCTQCYLPFFPSCNSGTCRLCQRIVCPSCLDDTRACTACRKERFMGMIPPHSVPPRSSVEIVERVQQEIASGNGNGYATMSVREGEVEGVEWWNMARPPIPQTNPDLIDHLHPRSETSWLASFWQAIKEFVLSIPGMHTPSEPDYSDVFPLHSRVLTRPVGRGGIIPIASISLSGVAPQPLYEPIPDVDYEQPMVMYPDVPETEREHGI